MSLVNEAIVAYDSGEDLTAYCEAAVTGKRFVAISDPKKVATLALSSAVDGGNIVVSPCGAGAKAVGISAYDAAQDAIVPVIRGHKVVVMTAGAAVTAGDTVMSDSTGRAIKYDPGVTTTVGQACVEVYQCGQALSTTTAAGQDIVVALDL